MAYMNQERKAVIAKNLKPVLKKYGIKGTLSVRNHCTIVLSIKAGKIDFAKDYGKGEDSRWGIDVNPYWFQDHFVGESKAFLSEAFDALKSAGHYDNSNASIDYFDTAYYFSIKVGQWNKPYTLTI
jgi:hypothetical protein